MNGFSNNKKGYIAAMGAIMALILVTTIIFFMFTIHKKQQSAISAFKNSFFNNKMKNNIAIERISSLYHNNLTFDLNDNEFMDGNILQFEDIDKEFKIEDVSDEFGIKNIPVSFEETDELIQINIHSPSYLRINSDLTDNYYETLAEKEGDVELYGAHDLSVSNDTGDITNLAKHSSDLKNTSNKLFFEENVIIPGVYDIDVDLHATERSISRNVPYSTSARINTKIEYELINRLVKITELTDGGEGKIYYLKIEDNSNPKDPSEPEEDISIYLLNTKDLDSLKSNKSSKGRDKN